MIPRLTRLFEWGGLHCFLLPLFFVLHNYLQYAGLASPPMALQLLAAVEMLFLGFFLLLLLLTRHAGRSGLITTLLGATALFYGVAKDFLGRLPGVGFLSRYSVLLPLLLLLTVWLLIHIIRKKDFRKTNLFLNVLFLLFILADGFLLAVKGSPFYREHNRLVKNNVLRPDTLAVQAHGPDVYFLVFDSYPGTRFLEQYLQYDNHAFDSLLRSRGFYVTTHPRSNYNRTAFSIAATLSMEYLPSITAGTVLEPRHYNQASFTIDHAAVPAAFLHMGYDICNLSVFDLQAHAPLWRENFMVLPERQMLLYNTLGERIKKDIGWNFIHKSHDTAGTAQADEAFVRLNYLKRDFNNRVIDSLLKLSLQPAPRPRFVYAHLYLPHPPFFYDRNGKSIPLNAAAINAGMENRQAFLSYLAYTNGVIERITGALLQDSLRRPVILLQSDHGYRDFRRSLVPAPAYHMNYSAFYFPDKDYSMLYDNMSNINSFPVVLNKYFHMHIPLRPDSCVALPY